MIAARYGATEQARETGADFCRLVSEGQLKTLTQILDLSVKQGAKIEIGGTSAPGERYTSHRLCFRTSAKTRRS